MTQQKSILLPDKEEGKSRHKGGLVSDPGKWAVQSYQVTRTFVVKLLQHPFPDPTMLLYFFSRPQKEFLERHMFANVDTQPRIRFMVLTPSVQMKDITNKI